MLFSEMLNRGQEDATAIVDSKGSVTYGAFRAAVAGFAAQLHDLGLAKGDRVALWGYNSANWLVAFFGIVRAGGVALLVNYSMGIDDAAELLRSANARFLVCGDNGQTKRRDDAMEALASAVDIEPSRCLDIRGDACNLASAYAGVEGLAEQRKPSEEGDTAFIIFTSGTTSAPKAVCISQRALTADARALMAGLEGTMGGSICVAVPLFHILGLLTSYVYLILGSVVCLPASYRADALVSMIGANQVSDMAAVGAVYQGLVSADGFGKKVVPHLRTCLIAGGMSTPVQMMRLELDFANATFINMYGQSEGAPLTMVRPSDLVELRAGTVGRAVDGVELRIAGLDGSTLPIGEVGEVLARGVCLMNGYEGLSTDDQAIDADGWLHTGDLGFLDNEGYLRLAGRIKDVIIRGGENISPAEIEAELISIEGVGDAKVMGAPHPIFGESVEACVTVQGVGPFDEGRVLEALRTRMPRYKVPTHIFTFSEFPLNVNGKLDQRSLYVSMLGKLREIEVDEELAGGITVFEITVKNSSYAIAPVAGLVSDLVSSIGYGRPRAIKIKLAVEEMLIERIMYAYSGAGDIHVRISLMPEWLRVSFSDNGAEYVIDKRRDTSTSARIILNSVDNFHTERSGGRPEYCMDFLYDGDLDVKGFLLEEKEVAEEWEDFDEAMKRLP
ncbi:MAG: AMP-binding protein [Atopobiaceae bacterium]|nr:AMP-binding protein [Atopobiaceae bacterium]